MTDINGKDKHQRIWGDIRQLAILEIGVPLFLYYDDGSDKVRTTTPVVGIQSNLDSNIKAVHTKNSIYHLKFLEV